MWVARRGDLGPRDGDERAGIAAEAALEAVESWERRGRPRGLDGLGGLAVTICRRRLIDAYRDQYAGWGRYREGRPVHVSYEGWLVPVGDHTPDRAVVDALITYWSRGDERAEGMLRLLADGWLAREVAEHYGVTESRVSQILRVIRERFSKNLLD